MPSYRVLDEIPEWRKNPKVWADINIEALPDEHRDEFSRRRKAIEGLLTGASYKQIKAETGISSPMVRYLLRRCLKDDGEGDICGYRALVKNIHISAYNRTAVVNRQTRSGRGSCAGALAYLFERYPEIEKHLVQELLKQIPRNEKISEARISIEKLHEVFIGLCRDIGLEASNGWPFNTVTWGISSIRLFVERVKNEKTGRYIAARYGKDAKTRMNVGQGQERFLDAQQPFDVVGLDEFSFDAITTIVLPTPGGGEQDVAIERIHIIVVIERVSTAILSWHAFFSPTVGVADLRVAIQKALTPWEKAQFRIPGMGYGLPDAGMPNGLLKSLAYHGWAVLMVDNALAHQDIALLADLGGCVGCAVNLGPVGQWYRRDEVERQIKELLENSAQRLPSTMGSHPKDTTKQDPVKTAVKLKIRWADVLELVEVTVAHRNAKSTERLGFLSPIALLRQKTSKESNHD